MSGKFLLVYKTSKYIVEQKELPQEEKVGIYRLIRLDLFLNLLAPIALAVYMAVQDLNKYAIGWPTKDIKIAYSLGSLCGLTMIVDIIIMFVIIQKTRQHLKDIGFSREVLDPNVLRNIYCLVAAILFVFISAIVGLFMRINAQESYDHEKDAKTVLMCMTIATVLFSIA